MKILQIENRKGKLKLNDGVYKESADNLIEELEQLYGPSAVAAHMQIGDIVCSADEALESVEVEINSPGGSVFEGRRIYSALRGMSERGVQVTTTVNGLAASMGSVILMAGDIRQMTKGSRVMIHEASTMAYGDARTMRRNADLLESISSEIAQIYAARTGGDEKEIRSLMLAETWMTADKAKEIGFIGEIIDYDKPKEDTDNSTQFDIGAPTAKTGGMSLLSKLFPNNDEAAKIEAAIADNDNLRAELETAQAKLSELSDIAATVALKDTEIQNLATEKAELQTKLEEAEAKIPTLEAEIVASKESAGAQAVEILAAVGQEQPLPSGDEAPVGATPHLDAYNKLSGREASAYFRKHSETIAAEIRIASKLS